MKWAAVILAGGSGTRLGGELKALIELEGERLVERAARLLVGADTVLVSCGPHDPRSWNLAADWLTLPDLPLPLAGPLAGLLAAIDWAVRQPLPPDAIVLAPVDSPLLPHDLPARLIAGLANAPASLACHAGELYPTSSAWRLDAIASLPREAAAGTAPRSLRRLAERLQARIVEVPTGPDGGNPLADLDTPADRPALARRLRRH